MKYKGGGTNMTLNQAIGDAAERLYLATAGLYHAVLSQIVDEPSRDNHLLRALYADEASSLGEYRALTGEIEQSPLEGKVTSTIETPLSRNHLVTNGANCFRIFIEQGDRNEA